jgi:hypothetical protein
MVLNLSYPAVSQIYILIVFPFKSKVLILKSTPIVGKKLSLNKLSENLNKIDDFPTLLLPINNNLNK